MDDVLNNAIARCPFLGNLAQREGNEFAKNFALRPQQCAADKCPRRPLLEELGDYSSSFAAFHGAHGLVPLFSQRDQRHAGSVQQASPVQPAPPSLSSTQPAPVMHVVHDAHGLARDAQPAGGRCPASQQAVTGAGGRQSTRPLPLATMSLSFGGGMPDFGGWLRALHQQQQQNKAREAKPRPKVEPKASATHSSTAPQMGDAVKPAGASGGATCPMRKMLGPLAPLVFNSKGHVQCPEAIVKARAALAATKPVRELRPQSLPIKLAAVGAVTAAVNLPFGMVREHTKKFSPGWFVAVHASIPFIAMLRKAVIMPKYAILFTIATAIAGQAMGARMERARMQRLLAEDETSSGIAKPSRITLASAADGRMSLASAEAGNILTSPTAVPRFKLAHGGHSGQVLVSSRRRISSEQHRLTPLAVTTVSTDRAYTSSLLEAHQAFGAHPSQAVAVR